MPNSLSKPMLHHFRMATALVFTLLLTPSIFGFQQGDIPPKLVTVAEMSNFEATSKSSQVVEFVQACADHADHVTRHDFGKTVAGKVMTSAIVANPKYEFGSDDKRAVVFLLGNIHSGECAGKEGLLILLRQFTMNPNHPLLKNLVVIIAPNYNADGNDKFAKTNRPGQKGPAKGMGIRPNNMGLDLNRDFIKLESPEAQNLIAFFNKTQPVMFIDCHTTNGSVHQYTLTYDIPHHPAAPGEIKTYMRKQMMPSVTRAVKKNYDYKTFYYGNFNRDRSRWTTYGYQPRYSTEYFGMRGGLGVLSEAYSYASYEDRILVSRAFVIECMNFVSENKDEVKKLVANARKEIVESIAKDDRTVHFPLTGKIAAFDNDFEIEGYDGDQPKNYSVKFFGKYQADKIRELPYGYTFPAKMKDVAELLKKHGTTVSIAKEKTPVRAEKYTITKVQQARREFQKHRMLTVEADLEKASHTIEKGDFVVTTAQPLGRIVAVLLEPESTDGVVAWNYMDEQVKEGSVHSIVRIPDVQEMKLEKAK